MTVPCKDCANRVVGCHSTCERYKAYKEEMEKQKQKENEFRESRRIDYEIRVRKSCDAYNRKHAEFGYSKNRKR